jgi:hypothetical protein
MPERDQGDHWDFLAADLGASATPEEETAEEETESPALELEPEVVEQAPSEPVEEEVVETQPVEEIEETRADDVGRPAQDEPKKRQRGQKGDRVVSGFGYRRGSVDWANLARELGVEAMEEVPSPIPPADTPSESEPSTIFDLESDEEELVEAIVVEEGVVEEGVVGEDVVGEVLEPIEEAPQRDEPAPQSDVGGFGAGILDELVPDPVVVQEERAEADEPQEERKGRRRRRRRKPRKPEADQVQTDEIVVVDEAEAESPTDQEPEQEPEQDPEQEESPRRRGRRRGGRKRAPRKEVTTESEGFGAGLAADAADDDQTASDEFEIFEAEDDEIVGDEVESTTGKERRGERSQDKTQAKKVTHRGIPCWDEAVGHIIDSNLEGRSKKPEPSGSRQRSGRRRGGDRSGNRGR